MGKHYHGDPAYERMADMQTSRQYYFRWTPRTARISIAYVVVVPVLVGTLLWNSNGMVDLRGKRRGDTMLER